MAKCIGKAQASRPASAAQEHKARGTVVQERPSELKAIDTKIAQIIKNVFEAPGRPANPLAM